jgi:hypothetical protein
LLPEKLDIVGRTEWLVDVLLPGLRAVRPTTSKRKETR